MTELEELAQRASVSARAHSAGDAVIDVTLLSGGHSGLTVAATLVGDRRPQTRVVIKAAPPGKPAVGRHDVTRQARLFRFLGGRSGIPVPEILFEETGHQPLFAMALVEGDSMEPILEEDRSLPEPAVLRARALRSAEVLAALHDLDADGVDEPVPIAAELERWARTMAAVDPTLVPGADRLYRALVSTVPAPDRASIVHGDYRLGNMLFAGPEPVGVIDWEIWTLTDSRADLGWYLLHFDPEEYPGIGPDQVPGLPSPREVLQHYEDTVGHPVTDWPWFDAFGRFKVAAIQAHNLKRHRTGRRVDPFQERLPPTIAHQLKTGLDRLGA